MYAGVWLLVTFVFIKHRSLRTSLVVLRLHAPNPGTPALGAWSLRTSLVVLRLHAPNAGVPGLIPSRELDPTCGNEDPVQPNKINQ